jgi:RNA polymerase sigma-70 factor (ECF subfamily)
MKELRDAELMLIFQREHHYAAFEELFHRHKDALLAFLIRLTGTRAVAEDVSQQSWLKVIESARQGSYSDRVGVTFRTWLCTLARNHFVDEYKRKFVASRTVPLPEFPELAGDVQWQSSAPDPAELVDQQLVTARLQQALLVLPFEQREVIAFWAAGVELAEIVAIVRAPRDTVLSRKKYAIAKLRTLLQALDPEKCGV